MAAALAAVLTAVLTAACGSSEPGSGGVGGPTVADPGLGGRYEVVMARLDDRPLAVAASVVVELDARFGGLAVETPCGTLLGAFTLDADGGAGVTIAGGTERSCGPGEAREVEDLRLALGRTEVWRADDPDLVLGSADGRTGVDLAAIAP